MAKMRLWIAKNINGGPEIKKRNLKALCKEIGLSYNTAKKMRKKSLEEKRGDSMRWSGENVIYDIWREEI